MRKFVILLAFLMSGLMTFPAQAAGLLDTLFGASEAPQYYGARAYAPNEPHLRRFYNAGPRFKQRTAKSTYKRTRSHKADVSRTRPDEKRSRSRGIVQSRVKPSAVISGETLQYASCCKNGEDPAALIYADTTLRRGDAYMSDQGIRIYTGNAGKAAFVSLRESSSLKRNIKAQLVAIERHAIKGGVKETIKADPLALQHQHVDFNRDLHRQIARATGKSPGKTIVDPRGKTVRLVGPYRQVYR